MAEQYNKTSTRKMIINNNNNNNIHLVIRTSEFETEKGLTYLLHWLNKHHTQYNCIYLFCESFDDSKTMV